MGWLPHLQRFIPIKLVVDCVEACHQTSTLYRLQTLAGLLEVAGVQLAADEVTIQAQAAAPVVQLPAKQSRTTSPSLLCFRIKSLISGRLFWVGWNRPLLCSIG